MQNEVIQEYTSLLCHCETQICKFAYSQCVHQMSDTSEMVVSRDAERQLLQYDWCSLLDVVQWSLNMNTYNMS